MTVSSIATIAAGLSRASSSQGAAKASSLLNSLFTPASKSSTTDTTNLTAALTLQNQVAQFRIASQNLAQAGSLLAAAEGGASGITKDLARLKDLATRAQSTTLSDRERADLAAEFAALRGRINGSARGSRFNNENLLDGSSAQLRVASENKNLKDISIGSLTDEALFKGTDPQVATPAAAKSAEAVIKEAIAYANTQLENIRKLQEGLDFASATLQSAIQNQDAAQSTLSEGDLLNTLLAPQNPVKNDVTSLLAQTNRLPNNLLQLLSE